MKATLILILTPLTLAAAFAPRNVHRIPAVASPNNARVAPLFKRSAFLFSKQDVEVEPTFGSAKKQLDTLNSGSEDAPMTNKDIDALINVLEFIQDSSKDTSKSDEIVESVLSKSDSEADEKVGTQDIVTETESPNKFAAPMAIARELPDNKVKTEEREPNPVIKTLLTVLKDLSTAGLGDYKEELGYDQYPKHPEFPNVPLSSMMTMVKGIPPLEYFFSAKKFARIILRAVRTNVGLQLTSDDVENASTYEEKFRAMFTKKKIGFLPNPLNLVPKPVHVFHRWDEDKEFARQFMCGTNPIMLSVVKDVKEQLTNPLIRFFKDDKTVDLEALAEQRRLFYVSYDDLADLKVNPHQAYPKANNPTKPQDEPRYFDAPVILFELSRDRQELNILSIQLDRTDDARVYSASTTDAETWLMAKSSVASADSQMHEWVSHLGMTHLTMEPHIVAMHNTLKKNNHKIYPFVKPMTRGTLMLNWAARNTLASFGADSFGDYMTSAGVGQFMQLIKKYWDRYSFFECSGMPNELAKRGFDDSFDMPCYLYREDGLKLWDAQGKFAANFVDEVYESDAEVAADKGLQEWADETTKKAAVKGFPNKFSDKETLVRTLQTLGWMCSGLHAAVNFPQYDYYTFVPNKPLGFRSNMGIFSKKSGGERDWIFQHADPYLEIQKTTIQTADVLVTPSKFCLDNLWHDFEGTPAEGPYKRFQDELKIIGDEINSRNKKSNRQGRPVYHYLHPSVVPASIDI